MILDDDSDMAHLMPYLLKTDHLLGPALPFQIEPALTPMTLLHCDIP